MVGKDQWKMTANKRIKKTILPESINTQFSLSGVSNNKK